MAKPTSIMTWATDDGATADPGDTRRETGFIAGRKLPAKWLNWILNQNGAWLTYLRDLHAEPEFLNKDYDWAGSHKFGTTGSTGVYSDLRLVGYSNEIAYADGNTGIAGLRERTVRIPLTAFVPSHTSGVFDADAAPGWKWYQSYSDSTGSYGPGWAATAQGDVPLVCEFPLPTESKLISARAHVQLGEFMGSIPSVTMEVGIARAGLLYPGGHTPYVVSVSRNSTGLLEAGNPDGRYASVFDANDTIDEISGSSHTGYLAFRRTVAGIALVNWVTVTFLDPGPRNF